MILRPGIRAKLLARVAMPILIASGLGACSDIPDWVDPTTWIGGDSQAASDRDQAAGTPADATAETAQTPDIASIPDKPTPPSTSDEQKEVADSLEADRTKAHYSADALRGGTEAAAPPPSAEPPPAPADQGTSNIPAPPPADTSQSQAGAAPAASGSTSADQSAEAAPPAPAPQPAAAPPPSAPANQMASADTASTSAPVAAPMTAATATSGMQVTFAPSNAPPLDASVAHFVPQPILSRYQQTAAAASAPGVAEQSSAIRPTHRHRKKAKPVAATQP